MDRKYADRFASRYEESIDKLIPVMPFSEERLALFLLVYLGADIHKPAFVSALNSEDGKLLSNAIDLLMGVVNEGQNHCGAKIIKELLGCQE